VIKQLYETSYGGEGLNTKLSAREELLRKLDHIISEKNALIKKNLPEKDREKYYDLLARQLSLEDYLREHDDDYIEKDKAFDRIKCPISAPYNEEWGGFEPSLEDSGDFVELCKHEDCPDYPDCWATKSTEAPVWVDLGDIDEEDEEPH
jgi:hypothetical protein